MIELDDCFYLGYVSKIRGYKGEVGVKLDVDFPEQYSEMESVFVVINKEPVPFFIETIQITPKGFANIKFEDVDDEASAKKMVGKELHLPLELLPALEGTQFYYHEVKGFKLIDETDGEIGAINQVLDYPNNPLFEVIHNYHEILVPINDDVLVSIDREAKEVHVKCPEGLLDLYRNSEEDEDQDY